LQIETFISVQRQTAYFLLSVVLGAGLGVVYDLFRVLRILFPPAAKPLPAAVQDILFWIIYGFCLFCYSAAVCGGQLRFFMLLGSLIGFTLYIVTLGSLITGILRRIVTAFYRILRKVYSYLFEPIVNLFRKLCQKIHAFFVRNHKNVPNRKISVKKHLQNAVRVVYNKKAEKDKSC